MLPSMIFFIIVVLRFILPSIFVVNVYNTYSLKVLTKFLLLDVLHIERYNFK